MYFINIIYKLGVYNAIPSRFLIAIIMRVSDITCGDEVNTINLCILV